VGKLHAKNVASSARANVSPGCDTNSFDVHLGGTRYVVLRPVVRQNVDFLASCSCGGSEKKLLKLPFKDFY